MSDLPPIPQAEASWLAAEHVLGLLDGAERADAERRALREPAFAAELEAWAVHFAPLFDEIAPTEPSAGVWPAIVAALDGRAAPRGPSTNNVISLADRRPAPGGEDASLRRRLGFWRVAGGAAVAASLVLIALASTGRLPSRPGSPLPPGPVQPASPGPVAPLMVASMKATKGEAVYVAAYDPARGRMTVVLPAGVAPADRSPELWLIGADGKPAALGVAKSGQVATMTVPAELGKRLAGGVVLALSIEPLGGSPTGQPTGPVVAAGPMQAVA